MLAWLDNTVDGRLTKKLIIQQTKSINKKKLCLFLCVCAIINTHKYIYMTKAYAASFVNYNDRYAAIR